MRVGICTESGAQRGGNKIEPEREVKIGKEVFQSPSVANSEQCFLQTHLLEAHLAFCEYF